MQLMRILFLILVFSSVTEAVTVLLPSESISEWVDTAPSGTTSDEQGLDFDNISTSFTISRVNRRGSSLLLFLRSEGVRAETIDLVSILGGELTTLISIDATDESSFELPDESILYTYSSSISLTDTQFESLRAADLQIVATPIAGTTFNSIPEPSTGILTLFACCILLRRRRTRYF